MAGFQEQTVTVDGFDAKLWRGGAGPSLLYLHGAGGRGPVLPFMEALAENFDVIVPEHPGFGPADNPDWLDNIHDVAYYYLDFLKALDLGQVHLVGMSLGGWIALEMAVRATERLRTLTLCGAAGIYVEGRDGGDMFLWAPEDIARNGFHDQAFAERMLSVQPSPAEQAIRMKNWQTVARLAWQPRWHDPHIEKWLHRIDVPSHVIWGGEDKILSVDAAAKYEKLIPGAAVTILPDCGHLMHIEKADAFVDAVTRFAEGAAA